MLDELEFQKKNYTFANICFILKQNKEEISTKKEKKAFIGKEIQKGKK